jgi:hypothetical protein
VPAPPSLAWGHWLQTEVVRKSLCDWHPGYFQCPALMSIKQIFRDRMIQRTGIIAERNSILCLPSILSSLDNKVACCQLCSPDPHCSSRNWSHSPSNNN